MTSREKMVENNLGLVHACAGKFKNRGVDYEDLFQAGCVGLIKAVDGFDESLGYVFSTYAVPAILGEIKRIFRDGGAVKVSRSMKERSREIWQQKEAFCEQKGREPTISELAEYVGLGVAETAQLVMVFQPVISLTAREDDTGKEFDIAVEGEQEQIAEKICLGQCIAQLSESDRKIIDLRYYKSQTQAVVARELGMTQVQISRREKKILKEMREKMSV